MEKEHYMKLALELAEKAADEGEVPVGCVIVSESGEVIGRGRNRREKNKNSLAHAEIEAIDEACRNIGDWRLQNCSMYVTLEPCPMCAGAIINARLPKLFYGAKEENYGSCGSVINLFEENYGHHVQIWANIMKDESEKLLKTFFNEVRKGRD